MVVTNEQFFRTQRERRIYRMLAEGMTTDEIARAIRCSGRSVDNDIHAVVARHELRNRTHAVAEAIRREAM